jgi:hypothetical protein
MGRDFPQRLGLQRLAPGPEDAPKVAHAQGNLSVLPRKTPGMRRKSCLKLWAADLCLLVTLFLSSCKTATEFRQMLEDRARGRRASRNEIAKL